MSRHTLGQRFNFGLRWLDAASYSGSARAAGASLSPPDQDWAGFLASADSLPPPRRQWIARGWPLLALINGPLALSGLMLWPQRSGVHILLCLLVFLLLPCLMLCWTTVNGMVLGRLPWWGRLLLGHRDRVIAAWCARQSLLLHGLFCAAGLIWLWLVLATRQVIFYWSTSIDTVSEQVADLLAALSLGVLAAPDAAAVAAAEAGVITGWRTVLLADSMMWAGWLTQVVALWVLLPCAILLGLCQWRLHRGVRDWPRYNQRLQNCFDERHRLGGARQPQLSFRALQPHQPLVETVSVDIAIRDGVPREAGFGWRVSTHLPPGSEALGEHDHGVDEALIRARGADLTHWYIASHAVPTGDLADLLHEHRRSGATPQLVILLDAAHRSDERLEALRHSWSVFLHRNDLSCPVTLLRSPDADTEPAVIARQSS